MPIHPSRVAINTNTTKDEFKAKGGHEGYDQAYLAGRMKGKSNGKTATCGTHENGQNGGRIKSQLDHSSPGPENGEWSGPSNQTPSSQNNKGPSYDSKKIFDLTRIKIKM